MRPFNDLLRSSNNRNCCYSCFRIFTIILIGIILVSCSRASTSRHTGEGVWHTIQPGETLESISRNYSISKITIQRINDIFDSNDLTPGMKLYIPAAKRMQVTTPHVVQKKSAIQAKFAWPSQGTISSGFGVRHGRMHEGIDITKDRGKDVRAAASGTVSFAGYKKGYGKTIIISHGNGFETLYAHNAKVYVKKGTRVKGGIIISQMGSSGRSYGVHLHFEIRYKGKPQNPLRYLPVR